MSSMDAAILRCLWEIIAVEVVVHTQEVLSTLL